MRGRVGSAVVRRADAGVGPVCRAARCRRRPAGAPPDRGGGSRRASSAARSEAGCRQAVAEERRRVRRDTPTPRHLVRPSARGEDGPLSAAAHDDAASGDPPCADTHTASTGAAGPPDSARSDSGSGSAAERARASRTEPDRSRGIDPGDDDSSLSSAAGRAVSAEPAGQGARRQEPFAHRPAGASSRAAARPAARPVAAAARPGTAPADGSPACPATGSVRQPSGQRLWRQESLTRWSPRPEGVTGWSSC
jgi:hypothetical protein